MLPDRYYVAEVREGPKHRRLYFYASTEGLNGPEYGYTEDDSWIGSEYDFAAYSVRQRLLVQPSGFEAVPGADVTVSEPREISPEEVVRKDPGVNVYVANAIELAKQEVGAALHPIRVTWHWQVSDDAGNEAAVYVKLADDTGASREGFGLQQLSDESLMKERIRRLYRKLLEDRSRRLVLDLLRMNAVAGKD